MVILCELEMYFPPAFFNVMVHLCVHIVDNIIDLGLSFLHNMMLFERMNGIIKGFIHDMSRSDGSIVQGYLTQECISCPVRMEASSRAILHKSASLSARIFYMAQTSCLVLVWFAR